MQASDNLTAEQYRFFKMVSEYPRMAAIWDWEKRMFDPGALRSELSVMSHGEAILLRFFVSVWLHRGEDFNFIEAATVLGETERALIADWIRDPIWP